MARFGFVGPSYTSESLNADAQKTMNWYVERNDAESKSAASLYPTPGLKVFCNQINGAQVRSEYTINGRTFAVIDASLCEIMQDGSAVVINGVGNDGFPASITASPQQLLIASAGLLYVYYLKTIGAVVAGTFTPIPPATFPGAVTQCGYSDGFFIALIAGSERYFVSGLLDATDWATNGSKIISVFPDNVVSMVIDHRELWLLGAKASEVEYDSGNLFPFDTVPGGFMEQGCASQFATVQMDNGIFWIGQRNDQGGYVAYRSQGYTPVRVSNHAVETAWESYLTVADARAFSYVMNGHSFWQINFPSAQATWVYDSATGLWHERGFWEANQGKFQAHRAQCHTFNFGKHLVGDSQSGTIYQMDIPRVRGGGWEFADDFGNAIRRVRRAPHISTENEWLFYARLQVDLETGVGPQPPLRDAAGNPRDPIASLRYSKDGGHTWSNYRDVGCGQAGNYRARAIWRRLGRARDCVFELSVSDPVPYRIVDAYLKATPGFAPTERMAKQYGKAA